MRFSGQFASFTVIAVSSVGFMQAAESVRVPLSFPTRSAAAAPFSLPTAERGEGSALIAGTNPQDASGRRSLPANRGFRAQGWRRFQGNSRARTRLAQSGGHREPHPVAEKAGQRARPGAAPAPAGSADLSALLHTAEDALARKDFAEAAKALKSVVAQSARHAGGLVQPGLCLHGSARAG